MAYYRERDRELEQVQAWRASLESKYARSDKKRLLEHKHGGITEETAKAHAAITEEMAVAYNKHMAILGKRSKQRKKVQGVW